jgi:hypothetical protein
MVKSQTLFEAQARAAAERIEAARAAGQQLALPLADEAADGGALDARTGRGRGQGKASSQMRDWLASRGYRMPEDVLAELAGLSTGEDAFMAAMLRAEQVLAWAKGEGGAATPAQRLDTFKFVLTAMLRSGEALLPYGLAKVGGEAAPAQVVQVVVQGDRAVQAGPTGPAAARDVTPGARRIGPPPMPHEMQVNQGLGRAADPVADGGARTE